MQHTEHYFSNLLSTKTLAHFPITGQTNCVIYLTDANQIAKDTLDAIANNHLHTDEIAIYNKRKHDVSKKEYIASRLAIKQHVSHNFNIPYSHLKVIFCEQEKSLKIHHLNQPLSLSCSISHSKGYVGIYIDDQSTKIGIDVEMINPKKSLLQVAKRYYHDNELALSQEFNEGRLYRIWTLKEAVAKTIKEPIARLLSKDVFSILNEYVAISNTVKNVDISVVSTNTSLTQAHLYFADVTLIIKNDDNTGK